MARSKTVKGSASKSKIKNGKKKTTRSKKNRVKTYELNEPFIPFFF